MNRCAESFPEVLWSSVAEVEQDCACSEEALVSLAGPETDCACAPAEGRAALPDAAGRLWERAPLLYRTDLPAGHALLFPA
ncbi:MAG: hypothetical protein ACP5NB_11655, partial [Chloroflexia bacterium]